MGSKRGKLLDPMLEVCILCGQIQLPAHEKGPRLVSICGCVCVRDGSAQRAGRCWGPGQGEAQGARKLDARILLLEETV